MSGSPSAASRTSSSTTSPLGVVGGAPAGQHQLQTGHEGLGEAVGVDDSHGVLEAVEARDLSHHRPQRVDVELSQNAVDWSWSMRQGSSR